MLSKLFKHEIKATARIFLPLFIVLLVYSVVYKGISMITSHQWQAPKVISMIIYIMILVGLIVFCLELSLVWFLTC